VNAVAVAYCAWVWVFMFFPTGVPVVATSMNWAVVMFFGVILIASIFFVLKARKTYFGPVTKVVEL
jgi:hypothetical protein